MVFIKSTPWSELLGVLYDRSIEFFKYIPTNNLIIRKPIIKPTAVPDNCKRFPFENMKEKVAIDMKIIKNGISTPFLNLICMLSISIFESL